jgi:hypothetical protein
MTAATVTFIIYFVGIAAITDRPGGGKIAIFPTARLGTFENVVLWPHRTYLHLRGSDFVNDEGQRPNPNPPLYCTDEVGGTWNPETGICSLELRGATLWTQTAEPFSQDETFKKIPAFGKLCGDAPDPKRVYTEGTDPDFVAARFEMPGGTLSGCNRKYGAFVTKLSVQTTYGVLVLERGRATLRIRLSDNAQLSLENRADVIPGRTHSHTTATNANNCNEYGREHFAWYHFMAGGDIRCPVRCPTLVENTPCGNIPGVTEPGTGLPSASGPDCGNTNYP